jgi:diaminopimelate epimerase
MSDVARHSGLPFMKMHGLGNDFVVIDARVTARAVTAPLARALADRHRGVGFDQLAVIEPDDGGRPAAVFYNADGSLSAACGNATRCIARHEMEVRDRSALTIRTGRGILQARDAGGGLTSVNMGQPHDRLGRHPAGRGRRHPAPAHRRRSGRHLHGQPALHLLRG